MNLNRLVLKNYRNYKSLDINTKYKVIVLSGLNAQGKTNILESVFVCCTGRSHRTTKDKELISWDKNISYIKSEIKKSFGNDTVEISLNKKDKKIIKINGMPIKKSGELMGKLNCVLFSPEDLKLVKQGPQERRRFLNMEISQIKPRYYYTLQQYNRIIRQRNNLLKDIANGLANKNTLFIWDEQLTDAGSYIFLERKNFLDELSSIAQEIHSSITNGNERIKVAYKSNIKLKYDNINEIKNVYRKELENSQDTDIRYGSTSCGCHRDDLIILVNGYDVRKFGSQGQQRTAALSVKLSEIDLIHNKTDEYPVLLLDDVMSELDDQRKSMLLRYLNKVQTFITTAEISSIPLDHLKDVKVYEVCNGVINNNI